MVRIPSYDDGFFDDGRQYFAKGLPAWKDFVLNELKAASLADFGCGQGDWLEPLLGSIPVWGCDGFADVSSLRVPASDFEKVDIGVILPSLLGVGKRDVVMSLEAMEHVAANRESNFLDCMLSPDPRLVVLGVAAGHGVYDPLQGKINRLGEFIPGGPDWKMQRGRHHVNCQPVDAVVEKMKKRGYTVNAQLSQRFSTLTVPGVRKKQVFAFAGFYRKNTRVYEKVTP